MTFDSGFPNSINGLRIAYFLLVPVFFSLCFQTFLVSKIWIWRMTLHEKKPTWSEKTPNFWSSQLKALNNLFQSQIFHLERPQIQLLISMKIVYITLLAYSIHGNRDSEEISHVTNLGHHTAMALYSHFGIFLQFYFKSSTHLLLANKSIKKRNTATDYLPQIDHSKAPGESEHVLHTPPSIFHKTAWPCIYAYI